MHKDKLKEILLDQKEVFSNRKGLIERDIRLENYISTGQVVVISGVRRCGKSSLLYLIKEAMKLNEADYCYFNFDDERIIPDTSILNQIFNLHIEIYGKEPVLFFDEIQNIDHWEKFINRVHEQGVKVFVTGSNAKLLSSEISSSLTGRNKQITLFPFSFAEYLRFCNRDKQDKNLSSKSKALIMKDLNQYMLSGGFPLVVKENDTEILNAYFQDIIYRDIIARYRITQVNEVRQIGLYLISNLGKLFSYSTLQKISGVKSSSSIKDYLEYFEQSYLFFYLKKFDYSVRKQVMNPKKAYTIDSGFANRLGFSFSENKGRIIENIVYLELLRQGKEVYYYAERNECDFLVKEGFSINHAIQVCYSIDVNSISREFDGLTDAMQTHNIKNGLLITFDQESSDIDYQIPQGINIIPLWRWLLQ
ncbi:MAG: ATP-binding protein [Tenuifilaceae bacterium]|nr:ATP-binding protein [Tenuifilaceae bacterium]